MQTHMYTHMIHNCKLWLGKALGTTIHFVHYKSINLIDALKNIPGVNGAAFVNQLPLAGCCFSTAMFPEGRPADFNSPDRLSILPISPGYFQTMRIPLIKGRVLDRRDTGPRERSRPSLLETSRSGPCRMGTRSA